MPVVIYIVNFLPAKHKVSFLKNVKEGVLSSILEISMALLTVKEKPSINGLFNLYGFSSTKLLFSISKLNISLSLFSTISFGDNTILLYFF